MAYLLAAYGLLWALVFGYVFQINRRQARVERELERMQQLLLHREGS